MNNKIVSLLSKKEHLLEEIKNDQLAFKKFLDQSSYFYNYDFYTQLEIYAQRPDATMCATYEDWITKGGRQVKKGSKGIAVLSNYRIQYLFDVNDTIDMGGGIPKVWELTDDNIELLLSKEKDNSLVLFVVNAIMENDYGLSSNGKKIVAYKILSRCQRRPEVLHDAFDFKELANLDINEFSNINIEATKITRLVMLNISQKLEKAIEENAAKEYNHSKDDKDKRRYDNERTEIQAGGRRTSSDSRTRSTTRKSGDTWEGSSEISGGRKTSNNNETSNDKFFEQVPDGGGQTSGGNDSTDRKTTSEPEQHQGGMEGYGYSSMGSGISTDSSSSERNSIQRTNIQLRNYDYDTEGKSFPYFNYSNVPKLFLTFNTNDTAKDIATYLSSANTNDSIEYLRNSYPNEDHTELEGNIYKLNKYNNGIVISRESVDKPEIAFIPWRNLINIYKSLELTSNLSLETFNTSPNINTYIIEHILKKGSPLSNGKFRIYEFFKENENTNERIAFLKNEYGTGGFSPFLNAYKSSVMYDAKGLEITLCDRKELFKYHYIATLINNLIKDNDYLSDKEYEQYKKWKQEKDFKALNEREKKVKNKKYYYDVGNDVYIGTNKYQILEVNKDLITLINPDTPLIKTEYNKNELNEKLIENPLNDHLLVDVVEAEIIDTESNIEISNDEPFEDPSPTYNNYSFNEANAPTGKKTQCEANLTAIELLTDIEKENRVATNKEQEVLSRYSGWGGISEVFDENNTSFFEERARLKKLLDDEEYKQAKESTLTAFYTPLEVIKGIYNVILDNEFICDKVLEPSAGIGNFIGAAPNQFTADKFTIIEKDIISGRIAKALYPSAKAYINGYEDTVLTDNTFDLAIGNIPFGAYSLYDKRYAKENFLIHDYFFVKSLDKLKTGGVIAFVTSKGTLDKKNSSFRKYIDKRCDFIGAIRLPNTIFKEYGNAKVTSDIVFLQKRSVHKEPNSDWVHLGYDENGIVINQYFVDNPEMIIGKMEIKTSQFGEIATCVLENNEDFSKLFRNALSNIKFSDNRDKDDIPLNKTDDELEEVEIVLPNEDSYNYSFSIIKNAVYYKEGSEMNKIEVNDEEYRIVKDYIEIRKIVRGLLQIQLEGYPDNIIEQQQELLNYHYDNFVKKYGYIGAKNINKLLHNDDSYPLISSLEKYDEDGKYQGKADIFYKKTIGQKKVIETVDTSSEALAVSLDEKGKIDLAFMKSILDGKEENDIIEDLVGVIFKEPITKEYVTADEYLSGNVREKLEIAKRYAEYDNEYKPNIEALNKVIPKDLVAKEVDVRLGSTWVDSDYINSFMSEVFNVPIYSNIECEYSDITGIWRISNKSSYLPAANRKYGTSRATALKLLEDCLNLRNTQIFDIIEDGDGEKKILNKKETLLANQKQDNIKAAFKDWVWKDYDRRTNLLRKYNDLFNSTVPRNYNGDHLNFPGMSVGIKLRKHQKDSVARQLYGGNTLLAHVVGAGKTYSMIAAAMEMKRLGLCTKSLFVVPNYLIDQWASEFCTLYPSANVLATTKDDFKPENRKRFCTRIATGDYDAIIIAHSQFEKIPLSKERMIYNIESQLDEILGSLAEHKHSIGQSFTVKQLESQKKKLEKKLKELNDDETKDTVITFEELGIDHLFVDEAHNYKNLMLTTKMRNVAGITTSAAKKSSDMYAKCMYLDEITGGKGITFATGTPVSNSMAEIYTMQKYLQNTELKRLNLSFFDSWASTFGETVTAIELAPEGNGYRPKTRFARFHNLPELMTLFKNCADIQTADMLNLPIPTVIYENIVLAPSINQKEMVKELGERAENVRAGIVDPTEDNMLKITTEGRKLALDERLINPDLDAKDGKTTSCVEHIIDIWEETKDSRSTQVVFCDSSTPKEDGTFNVYDDIKSKLIENGIPENEIAFIHDAKTEAQKRALFAKVKTGKVRVLMGSTAKLGAGANVQDKLIALHHLDVPWKPSDIEQQEGRILRQGNENDEVRIYRYITEGTFDAYSWQLIENKQKFISQIMTSKNPARCMDEIDDMVMDIAQVKALAAGNPAIKEKMDLEVEINKLKIMKAAFLDEQYDIERQVYREFPAKIKLLNEKIKTYSDDIIRRDQYLTEDFKIEINNVIFADRKEAGTKIYELCKMQRRLKKDESLKIGIYNGFEMYVTSKSFFSNMFILTLKGSGSHSIDLGDDPVGNIKRMSNILIKLENRIDECKNALKETEIANEQAKQMLGKEWPHSKKFQELNERLDAINAELNIEEENIAINIEQPSFTKTSSNNHINTNNYENERNNNEIIR